MGCAPLGGWDPCGSRGGAERTDREYSKGSSAPGADAWTWHHGHDERPGSRPMTHQPAGPPGASDGARWAGSYPATPTIGPIRTSPHPASVHTVERPERPTRTLLLLCAERDDARAIAAPLTSLGVRVVATPYGPSAADLARDAEVVILDHTPGVESTAIITELKATADVARVPVLAIARSDSVEERIELLEAGADDVMARPLDNQELAARVDGLLRRPKVALPAPVADRSHADRGPGPRLFGFFAAKGGVGTTTIAVNTAIRLADRGASPVALLDLDPWWGQVATQLDLAPRMSVADLGRDLNGIDDAEVVRTYALQHPSGVSVFTSPVRPDSSVPLTQDQIERVLDALRASYDFVIVDGGSTLDERAQVLLARADKVVVVVSPEIPAVRATRLLLDQMAEFEDVSERVVLTLNHIFAAGLVKAEDLRRSLQAPVHTEIPYDPVLYLKAVNEGIPVVISSPASAPATALRRLADRLRGEEPAQSALAGAPPPPERKAFLRGLRRGR